MKKNNMYRGSGKVEIRPSWAGGRTSLDKQEIINKGHQTLAKLLKGIFDCYRSGLDAMAKEMVYDREELKLAIKDAKFDDIKAILRKMEVIKN